MSSSKRNLPSGPRNRSAVALPFEPSDCFIVVLSCARSDDETQPVARCAVATAPQAVPAAANEWGITLEDSSVDDPSAASGGAALPEGLFYAFERSTQPSSSAQSSGGAAAGAAESVDDLMAQLQGL